MRIVRAVLIVAVLAIVLNLASGVAYDARIGGQGASACLALPQRATRSRVDACEAAIAAIWTQALPTASRELVRYARMVWGNAELGRNTVQ
jgi:lysylphosphatidylglycerol synthetase-like protein (DUF2156 family)